MIYLKGLFYFGLIIACGLFMYDLIKSLSILIYYHFKELILNAILKKLLNKKKEVEKDIRKKE